VAIQAAIKASPNKNPAALSGAGAQLDVSHFAIKPNGGGAQERNDRKKL